ncbi:MAG: alkaline phosphatase family protein [Clostridia bacterium]|nr:alkaline phosphatase family protein [Clostridia bacterium]
MKKKFFIIALAVVLVAGAVAFPFVRYMVDFNDTEEAYRAGVVHSGLRDNTIETAIPQTELYNIIKNHFESELPDGKTEKKAIIIGYDGCRVDALKLSEGAIKYMIENGASANYSYCGGVNYPEKNTQDTSTAPGWCSILTGVWADKHGITENDITKSMEYKTLLTSLVEDKTIDSSMFVTKWKGHFDRDNATYLEEKAYCEENNLNVVFNRCDDDEDSFVYTIKEIEQQKCADFLFVIYEHTDSAGHNSGFTYNNPKYREAFIEMDNYGYDTIKAIEGRETYETEDWLIIITSDHGGIGTNHGDASIQERMTFIVSNKEF